MAVGSCMVKCTLVFKQVPLRINQCKGSINRAFMLLKKVLVFFTATSFANLAQISILTMESKWGMDCYLSINGHICVCLMLVTHPPILMLV